MIDLILTMVSAVVVMGFCLAGTDCGIVGALFALFVPGYVLTEVLLARDSLSLPERIAYSIGLSLVAAVLWGLVLHVLGLGIGTMSWAFSFGPFTLILSLVALFRRITATSKPNPRKTWVSGFRVPPLQVGILALAVGIMILATAVAIAGAENEPTPGFTQLWMLPGSGDTVRVGIHNYEHATMQYDLELVADGQTIAVWDSLELASDELWETEVAAPGNYVELILYNSGERYRRVSLQRGR